MSVLEKVIENTVCQWARSKGFLALKVKFVENGYPDRLFISPQGHTVFIEFKAPGEAPDPIQLYRLRQLQEHNIPAFWSDNVIESISILSAAVDPSRVSGESNPSVVKSGVRRIILGSGPGEDVNSLGNLQDTSTKAVSPEDAYSRAASALLQSLAGRDKEMGELLKPALEYLTRKTERAES
jgi:hypothetical protein